MNVLKLQPYFLLALLLAAFLLSFLILQPFLAPLLLGAIFAVIFYPIYTRILALMGGKQKSLAAFATVLVSAASVALPLLLISSQVAHEAQQLYLSLLDGSGKTYLGSVLSQIDQLFLRYFPGTHGIADTVSTNIDTYAREGTSWLLGYLGGVFSGVVSLLLKFFIFFIALYYFLRDGVALKNKIIDLSPLADIDDRTVFARLERAINSVVKGNLTIALIQGVLTAIGFFIFGVPNAVLWGTVASIAALIPGFGTALVLVPGALFVFVTGHTWAAVGLLVWGVFAVGLIDNVLGPKLIGHASGLHPLMVLLSVLGGIIFFGPIGIFLGPLVLSFLLALLSIYSYVSKQAARQ